MIASECDDGFEPVVLPSAVVFATYAPGEKSVILGGRLAVQAALL